jgi:hypothetical protein
MKNFIQITLIILVILLQFSCAKEKALNSEGAEAIDIVLSSENQAEMSDHLRIEKALKLETTEESLIGNIDKIIKKKDRIYILDRLVAKALFVFDTEGTFLFKISNIGKGPGEFLSPNDFFIDTDGIKILCDATYKVITWNKSGDFISEQRMPYPILNFYPYSKDITFFENKPISDFAIWIAKEGELVDKFIEKNNESTVINPGAAGFKSNGDFVTIRPHQSDVIYEIKDDLFKPKFSLNYKRSSEEGSAGIDANEKEKISIMNYELSDQFLLLNFQYNNQPFVTLYQFDNKVALTSLNNKVSGEGYFYISAFLSTVKGVTEDGLFVSFVPFGGVKNLPKMVEGLDKRYLDGLAPVLQYSPDIKEGDNPILIFLKPIQKL